MPDIDGGHYFLSALVPVLTEPVSSGGAGPVAPSHVLRETLATLPTAMQSGLDMSSGMVSPFSRCTRTHFVRLFVIDQPNFNGRLPSDAIVQAVRNTPLLKARPVDRLATPWLAVIIDFDARGDEGDGGLASYCEGLWQVMQLELTAIFSSCFGFDAVRGGADFAAWIKRCQVETTMPFNDYWTTSPPLPSLSLNQLVAGFGAVALVLGLAGYAGIRAGGLSCWWLALVVPVALGLAAWLVYRFVMARGARPFPTAPHADLPSVLKALYLQQRFARFAIAAQGADDMALYQAFGAFVAAENPADTAAPTRLPGRIDA